MNKIKVLWVVNHIMEPIANELSETKPVSGSWLVELSQQIASHPEVDLYIVGPHKEDMIINKNNITYINIQTNFKDKFIKPTKKYKQKVDKLVEKIKPNIIHIHGTEFAFNLAFLNHKEVPSIISIQGLISEINKYKYEYAYVFEKSFLKYAKNTMLSLLLMEMTKHIRNSLRAKSEINQIKMSRNIIGRTNWDRAHSYFINPDSDYYSIQETIRKPFLEKKWNINNKKEFIIFCAGGYSNPLKGFHIILKSISLLKKEFPTLRVRVVGENLFKTANPRGYKKFLLNLIFSEKLDKSIEFTGRLDAHEMANEFINSHIYVMGSSIENSSNTLAEAMCIGIPSIVPYVGGNATIANDYKEVLYYRFGDVEHLAWNIREILINEKLAVALNKNAMNRALRQYQNIDNINSLLKIYNNIIITN